MHDDGTRQLAEITYKDAVEKHGCLVNWDPFNPDWIASAANVNLAHVMINTQHPIYIHLKNEQIWATVVETKEEEKLVKMRTKNGDTFTMKSEGQDTTTGYPTLREAIQRSSPTLVQLSQVTEPNRIYGTDERIQGSRKIGWAQVI